MDDAETTARQTQPQQQGSGPHNASAQQNGAAPGGIPFSGESMAGSRPCDSGLGLMHGRHALERVPARHPPLPAVEGGSDEAISPGVGAPVGDATAEDKSLLVHERPVGCIYCGRGGHLAGPRLRARIFKIILILLLVVVRLLLLIITISRARNRVAGSF